MKISYKQKRVLFLGLLAIIAIALILASTIALSSASTDPPVGQQTAVTTQEGTISGTGVSGTVWQSLHITPVSGAAYWANAPEQFSLMSIFGSNGKDFSEVKAMQNTIYMNLPTSGISTWSFSCIETISVVNAQGQTVKTVADAKTVTASGQSVIAGQNTPVTGATVTAQQLESILSLPKGSYYFTVTLSNINLQMTVNGQPQTLSAQSGSPANVLSWPIQIK